MQIQVVAGGLPPGGIVAAFELQKLSRPAGLIRQSVKDDLTLTCIAMIAETREVTERKLLATVR